MAFDVDAARKAGYSDAEIADHLAKAQGFNLAGAKKAGYTDAEVIANLAPRSVGAPPPAPSIVDRAIGAGEAALSTITGATGGLLGSIGGAIGGAAGALVSGDAYLPPGTDPARVAEAQARMSDAVAGGAQALTYAPRTEQGQAQAQAIGEGLQQLVPAAPVMQALAVPGAVRSAAPARVNARAAIEGTARDVAGPGAAAAVAKTVDTAAQVPAALKSAYEATTAKISKGFGMSETAASRADGGSVGAAGVERATRLDATAGGLPVPVRLTRGEATGDAAQIRFEQEQAKGPLGAPIRERSAETNRALPQNLEALFDETGAETASHIEAGRSVAGTLARAEGQARLRERSAWRKADEAGALSDLVDLQPVADYLNQNRAGRSSAPIMEVIARELEVQGLGSGSLADGTLAIGPVNLKQAEALRKAVNKFVKDNDPSDLRVGSEIKRAIDAQTETIGNELYQQARKTTQRREQLFNQNAIVSQLIKNRKGTADRQVALEDVFRKTILEGDRADLSMLRRTLDVTDQHAGLSPGKDGPGAQAWRELQGATLRHMLDEAQKGFSVGQDGAQRFSGAQYAKVLRDLERGGKLEFIFGKRRAQTLRDVAEVARAVQAFPAGAVNSSNTASVILQAIGEAGLTGSLTGLPVPAVSLIRAGSQAIKDAKTRRRINEALRPQGRSEQPERSAAPTF